MKFLISLLPLLSLFAIFTSCYPSQVSTSSNAMMEPDELYATSWDLAELNGTTIIADDDDYSYLTFTPGTNRITGYTGCNYIGGTITMRDVNGITFSPVATTNRVCADNTIDAVLFPALRDVDSWAIVNDDLVVYKNGKAVARFEASDYRNTDLYGNWQLSYVNDDAIDFDALYPASYRPSLIFSPGSNMITGTTGYSQITCPVSINRNGISFATCAGLNTTTARSSETMFLDDLGGINNYSLADNNTLVLYRDGDIVMRFTRR